LINQLKLQRCEHTRVGNGQGGLSGGEKKRLSAAIELVTDPTVIYLDEVKMETFFFC